MATASYRLEAPRPRPPPIPIRTHNLVSKSPSQLTGNKDSPQTLLYDLPASPPHTNVALTSPTSPTYRSRSRASRAGMRMTPPPSRGLSRAPTPSQAVRNDLEEFAEQCRAWYYNQDDKAGRAMTQTLATLPSSQRAPFTRLQSAIRSAYHASVNARRNAEFQAHLAATVPGASLMPHSRADPDGPLARKERYDRLDRFVRTWCNMGMPGTKPFFEGLWAVFRLQVIPEELGGAGNRRIEWEIDDAVFKEAAGKDFMLDAIDVLKGVLGFEEVPSSRRSPSFCNHSQSAIPTITRVHSRSQSQPLPSDPSAPTRLHKNPGILSTTQTKRPRAPSDPFLDTPTLSASYSSGNTTAQLSTSGSTLDDPPSPRTPVGEIQDFISLNVAGHELPDAEQYLRIWTSPDLSDPEYLSLLNIFPAFVMRHPLPRFPVPSATRRLPDEEQGEDLETAKGDIRVGTGNMWLGYKERSPGWQGNWWTRFKLWFRRLFCC